MSGKKGLKNKLFKGLTEHDVLTWEEEKMRYQRRLGRKTTDLEFLRYLLMAATRPVITSKDGTQTSYLTGQGPIYEKADTLLTRFRSHSLAKEMASTNQQKMQPRDRIEQ